MVRQIICDKCVPVFHGQRFGAREPQASNLQPLPVGSPRVRLFVVRTAQHVVGQRLAGQEAKCENSASVVFISRLKLSVSGQENHRTSQLTRPHLVTEVCGRSAVSEIARQRRFYLAPLPVPRPARHARPPSDIGHPVRTCYQRTGEAIPMLVQDPVLGPFHVREADHPNLCAPGPGAPWARSVAISASGAKPYQLPHPPINDRWHLLLTLNSCSMREYFLGLFAPGAFGPSVALGISLPRRSVASKPNRCGGDVHSIPD